MPGSLGDPCDRLINAITGIPESKTTTKNQKTHTSAKGEKGPETLGNFIHFNSFNPASILNGSLIVFLLKRKTESEEKLRSCQQAGAGFDSTSTQESRVLRRSSPGPPTGPHREAAPQTGLRQLAEVPASLRVVAPGLSAAPGRARPALTLGAVAGPVEVLRAAVAEGPAKAKAEEIEHPAGSYRLSLGHWAWVFLLLRDPHLHLALQQLLALELLLIISRRFCHSLFRGLSVLPIRTPPRARSCYTTIFRHVKSLARVRPRPRRRVTIG